MNQIHICKIHKEMNKRHTYTHIDSVRSTKPRMYSTNVIPCFCHLLQTPIDISYLRSHLPDRRQIKFPQTLLKFHNIKPMAKWFCMLPIWKRKHSSSRNTSTYLQCNMSCKNLQNLSLHFVQTLSSSPSAKQLLYQHSNHYACSDSW